MSNECPMSNIKIIIWIIAILIIISLTGYFGLTQLLNKRQISNPKFQNIKIADQILTIEIADTPQLRQQGLSDQETLDASYGMLFIFDQPGLHSFWMKNMNFPLDIIWFDEKQKAVEIISSAEPEGTNPKKIYQPSDPAKYVLEVAAGFAKKYDIQKKDEFIFLPK